MDPILDKLFACRWEELTQWIKIHPDPLEEVEDPTSCWTSIRYFGAMLGFSGEYPEEVKDFSGLSNLSEGLYACTQMCSFESHYYVLYLKGEDLYLLQTYGGKEGVSFTKHPKTKWLQDYAKMVAGNDLEFYQKLFEIKELCGKRHGILTSDMQLNLGRHPKN